MRKSNITRDEAFALLRKYNKEPFHIQHALTVEGVMRRYAEKLGYGDEADYWGIVGLLHDIDFELYPDEHCKKAPCKGRICYPCDRKAGLNARQTLGYHSEDRRHARVRS